MSSNDASISSETMALAAHAIPPRRYRLFLCTAIRSPRSDSDLDRHLSAKTKCNRSHVRPTFHRLYRRSVSELSNGNTLAELATLVFPVRSLAAVELPS